MRIGDFWRAKAAIPSPFWAQHVSRRAAGQFFIAVIILFSVVGAVYDMAAATSVSWPSVVLWTAWSGLIAAGWAYGFTHDRRLLLLVVPASFLMPPLLGDAFWGRAQDPHRAIMFLVVIALVTLGYVMFIYFVSTEGNRSMRMSAEMRLAREIHENLVPPLALQTPRVDVRGRSDPTTEVGGDLLDAVAGAERDAVFVADVTGHGVPAGVLMVMVKSAIRVQLSAGVDLQRLTSTVNTVLHESTSPSLFATFAALQFEPGRVRVAIAGHPPVAWIHAGTGAVELLQNEHPPLGILPVHEFSVRTFPVQAGDTFVVFTDGMTEVRDAAGVEFGEERFLELVRRHAPEPLDRMERALFDAVRAFGRQDDDQTLVVVRVRDHAAPQLLGA